MSGSREVGGTAPKAVVYPDPNAAAADANAAPVLPGDASAAEAPPLSNGSATDGGKVDAKGDAASADRGVQTKPGVGAGGVGDVAPTDDIVKDQVVVVAPDARAENVGGPQLAAPGEVATPTAETPIAGIPSDAQIDQHLTDYADAADVMRKNPDDRTAQAQFAEAQTKVYADANAVGVHLQALEPGSAEYKAAEKRLDGMVTRLGVAESGLLLDDALAKSGDFKSVWDAETWPRTEAGRILANRMASKHSDGVTQKDLEIYVTTGEMTPAMGKVFDSSRKSGDYPPLGIVQSALELRAAYVERVDGKADEAKVLRSEAKALPNQGKATQLKNAKGYEAKAVALEGKHPLPRDADVQKKIDRFRRLANEIYESRGSEAEERIAKNPKDRFARWAGGQARWGQGRIQLAVGADDLASQRAANAGKPPVPPEMPEAWSPRNPAGAEARFEQAKKNDPNLDKDPTFKREERGFYNGRMTVGRIRLEMLYPPGGAEVPPTQLMDDTQKDTTRVFGLAKGRVEELNAKSELTAAERQEWIEAGGQLETSATHLASDAAMYDAAVSQRERLDAQTTRNGDGLREVNGNVSQLDEAKKKRIEEDMAKRRIAEAMRNSPFSDKDSVLAAYDADPAAYIAAHDNEQEAKARQELVKAKTELESQRDDLTYQRTGVHPTDASKPVRPSIDAQVEVGAAYTEGVRDAVYGPAATADEAYAMGLTTSTYGTSAAPQWTARGAKYGVEVPTVEVPVELQVEGMPTTRAMPDPSYFLAAAKSAHADGEAHFVGAPADAQIAYAERGQSIGRATAAQEQSLAQVQVDKKYVADFKAAEAGKEAEPYQQGANDLASAARKRAEGVEVVFTADGPIVKVPRIGGGLLGPAVELVDQKVIALDRFNNPTTDPKKVYRVFSEEQWRDFQYNNEKAADPAARHKAAKDAAAGHEATRMEHVGKAKEGFAYAKVNLEGADTAREGQHTAIDAAYDKELAKLDPKNPKDVEKREKLIAARQMSHDEVNLDAVGNRLDLANVGFAIEPLASKELVKDVEQIVETKLPKQDKGGEVPDAAVEARQNGRAYAYAGVNATALRGKKVLLSNAPGANNSPPPGSIDYARGAAELVHVADRGVGILETELPVDHKLRPAVLEQRTEVDRAKTAMDMESVGRFGSIRVIGDHARLVSAGADAKKGLEARTNGSVSFFSNAAMWLVSGGQHNIRAEMIATDNEQIDNAVGASADNRIRYADGFQFLTGVSGVDASYELAGVLKDPRAREYGTEGNKAWQAEVIALYGKDAAAGVFEIARSDHVRAWAGSGADDTAWLVKTYGDPTDSMSLYSNHMRMVGDRAAYLHSLHAEVEGKTKYLLAGIDVGVMVLGSAALAPLAAGVGTVTGAARGFAFLRGTVGASRVGLFAVNAAEAGVGLLIGKGVHELGLAVGFEEGSGALAVFDLVGGSFNLSVASKVAGRQGLIFQYGLGATMAGVPLVAQDLGMDPAKAGLLGDAVGVFIPAVMGTRANRKTYSAAKSAMDAAGIPGPKQKVIMQEVFWADTKNPGMTDKDIQAFVDRKALDVELQKRGLTDPAIRQDAIDNFVLDRTIETMPRPNVDPAAPARDQVDTINKYYDEVEARMIASGVEPDRAHTLVNGEREAAYGMGLAQANKAAQGQGVPPPPDHAAANVHQARKDIRAIADDPSRARRPGEDGDAAADKPYDLTLEPRRIATRYERLSAPDKAAWDGVLALAEKRGPEHAAHARRMFAEGKSLPEIDATLRAAPQAVDPATLKPIGPDAGDAPTATLGGVAYGNVPSHTAVGGVYSPNLRAPVMDAQNQPLYRPNAMGGWDMPSLRIERVDMNQGRVVASLPDGTTYHLDPADLMLHNPERMVDAQVNVLGVRYVVDAADGQGGFHLRPVDPNSGAQPLHISARDLYAQAPHDVLNRFRPAHEVLPTDWLAGLPPHGLDVPQVAFRAGDGSVQVLPRVLNVEAAGRAADGRDVALVTIDGQPPASYHVYADNLIPLTTYDQPRKVTGVDADGGQVTGRTEGFVLGKVAGADGEGRGGQVLLWDSESRTLRVVDGTHLHPEVHGQAPVEVPASVSGPYESQRTALTDRRGVALSADKAAVVEGFLAGTVDAPTLARAGIDLDNLPGPVAQKVLDAYIKGSVSPAEQMMYMRAFGLNGKLSDVAAFEAATYRVSGDGTKVKRTPLEIMQLGTADGLVQYYGHSCTITSGQYMRAMANPAEAVRMVVGGKDALVAEQAHYLKEHDAAAVPRPEADAPLGPDGQPGMPSFDYSAPFQRADGSFRMGGLEGPALVRMLDDVIGSHIDPPVTYRWNEGARPQLVNDLWTQMSGPNRPPEGMLVGISYPDIQNGQIVQRYGHAVVVVKAEIKRVTIDGRVHETQVFTFRDPGNGREFALTADQLQNPSAPMISGYANRNPADVAPRAQPTADAPPAADATPPPIRPIDAPIAALVGTQVNGKVFSAEDAAAATRYWDSLPDNRRQAVARGLANASPDARSNVVDSMAEQGRKIPAAQDAAGGTTRSVEGGPLGGEVPKTAPEAQQRLADLDAALTAADKFTARKVMLPDDFAAAQKFPNRNRASLEAERWAVLEQYPELRRAPEIADAGGAPTPLAEHPQLRRRIDGLVDREINGSPFGAKDRQAVDAYLRSLPDEARKNILARLERTPDPELKIVLGGMATKGHELLAGPVRPRAVPAEAFDRYVLLNQGIRARDKLAAGEPLTADDAKALAATGGDLRHVSDLKAERARLVLAMERSPTQSLDRLIDRAWEARDAVGQARARAVEAAKTKVFQDSDGRVLSGADRDRAAARWVEDYAENHVYGLYATSEVPQVLEPPTGPRTKRDAYLAAVDEIMRDRPAGSLSVVQGGPHAGWVQHGFTRGNRASADAFDDSFIHFYPPGSSGKAAGRVYVNSDLATSPEVMRFIVTELVDKPGSGVIGAKINGPDGGARPDKIVIYVDGPAGEANVLRLLGDYQQRHPEAFRPEVPSMSEPRLVGVSTGAEPTPAQRLALNQARGAPPDEGVSFGQVRAWAIHQALKDTDAARATGGPSFDGEAYYRQAVNQRLRQVNVDPDHPQR